MVGGSIDPPVAVHVDRDPAWFVTLSQPLPSREDPITVPNQSSPQPDRPQPSGRFDLVSSARLLGHHAWLEMRLFEVLGGWVAAVPELDVKAKLGAHSFHHAWHGELWRERMPELDSLGREQLIVPSNEGLESFVGAMAEPVEPDRTIEKLVGVYRVLIPHKIVAYTHHLRITTPVADEPTARSLRFILQDELDDWRDGEMLIQSLLRSDEDVARAAAHQGRLERLLIAAGGVVGDPVVATAGSATDVRSNPSV